MEFKQNPHGSNLILEGNGFFISYNAFPGMSVSMFASDNQSDETALVKNDDSDNKYRILNGDYRKEYEALVSDGFEACLAFYNKMSVDHDSSWSTHQNK